MKICVPTRDARGFDSRVNEEFEHTPYFAIVDTKTGELEVVPGDRHSGQAHRTHHVSLMHANAVDAVVCRGMSKRSLIALERAGVKVFVSNEEDLPRIVERAWENRLQLLTLRDASEGPKATRPRRGRRGVRHWRDRFHELVGGRRSHGPGAGHRPRQSRRSI